MIKLKHIACIVGLLGVSSLLSGCNIVGPVMVLLSPPPKVPKAYALPLTQTGVVFIDAKATVMPQKSLRQAIGVRATEKLLANKVMAEMVDTRTAAAVASKESADAPLTITQIGRLSKADVVIWVKVDAFYLTPDGISYSPGAQLHIKVIDATNDKKLWPEEKVGYSLLVTPAAKASALPSGTGEQQKAEQALAEIVGNAVAELFYDEDVTDSSRLQKPTGK